MYDLAITRLYDHLDKHLFIPNKNWSKIEYDKRLYSRWVIFELISLLIEESLKIPTHISGKELLEPIEICNSLFNDLDYYYSISSTDKTSVIFLIAEETIKDIMWLMERR